jgi:anti-anti-sigma factor
MRTSLSPWQAIHSQKLMDTLVFRRRFTELAARAEKGPWRVSIIRYAASRLHPGDATLDLETKTQDGVRIVKLKGRLCMGPALERFDAVMNELLGAGHNRIILDLEEVPTIDSSGIGMLVRFLTSAKRSGGAIHLLKPSPFTVQTLRMVGLLNLFAAFEELPQAVASFP